MLGTQIPSLPSKGEDIDSKQTSGQSVNEVISGTDVTENDMDCMDRWLVWSDAHSSGKLRAYFIYLLWGFGWIRYLVKGAPPPYTD